MAPGTALERFVSTIPSTLLAIRASSPYVSLYNLGALPSAFVIADGELVDGEMSTEKSFRRNIEKLLDCKVYLDLYVKVRNDWQNNDAMLGSTGLGKDIDD